MDIATFNYPTEHPFGLFGKVEIESFMWWFLVQCFQAKDLDAVVTTKYNQDHLVKDGLLKKVDEQ